MQESQTVAYMPCLLKSMTEICKQFGVGRRQVRGWIQAGAPIAVEGQGARARYSAELLRLQLWRERQTSLPVTDGN